MEREFKVDVMKQTAKEFINMNSQNGSLIDLEKIMIEFAKLHVEAALKAASEGQIKKDIYMMTEYGESMNWKDSILNSYPLENIK